MIFPEFYQAAFWLAVAIVMGVIEASTLGLTTIWFLFGALMAMGTSMLGLALPYQIAVFLASSCALLYFTRPIVKRYFKPRIIPTNAGRVIGQTGVVVRRLDPVLGTGQVKVAGQIWSAVPADGHGLTDGTKVKVLAITGVKLLVERIAD